MAAPSSTGPAAGPSGPPGDGLWRSARRFADRMPLRVKLIAALLTLVVAGLAAISVGGAFVLRGYLHSNADRQITSQFNQANMALQQGASTGRVSAFVPTVSCFAPYVEVFIPAQVQPSFRCQYESGIGSLPQIPGTSSWLTSHSGQLVTVGSQPGSSDTWRVLTKQVVYSNAIGGQLTGTLKKDLDGGSLV